MTIATILADYNELAETLEMPTLKAWKGRKQDLLDRVNLLREEVRRSEADAEAHGHPVKPSATESSVPTARLPKGTIGSLVKALLVTEMQYEEILDYVREMFPSAKTSRRSIASVAADLRRKGVDVPMRGGEKGSRLKATKRSELHD